MASSELRSSLGIERRRRAGWAPARTLRGGSLTLFGILVCFSIGCGGPHLDASNATFPAASYVTLASDSGNLTIEVRTAPEQPFHVGGGAVQYRVTDAQGVPVDGLLFDVTPWMPAMGHGASVKPSAAPAGGGAYVVRDVSLYMAGQWELRTVVSGAAADSVTPSIEVQ